MELREKTEGVFGLPGGTQIGLEHGKKYPMDYDHQPSVYLELQGNKVLSVTTESVNLDLEVR